MERLMTMMQVASLKDCRIASALYGRKCEGELGLVKGSKLCNEKEVRMFINLFFLFYASTSALPSTSAALLHV